MTPIRFADFRLDATERRLDKGGVPVELGGRAFDLLLALVHSAGRLVSKDELLDRVWPDVIVEEANLHVQMTALRKAIGRDAIATVPGRGYQFVLPLRTGEAASAPPFATGSAPPPALAALPPLLGRDDALARTARALADPARHGFVTITGAGGSGKTLLARHIAARFGTLDGAAPVWVDLLELTAPEAVVPVVAVAAGLQPPPRNAVALARALAGQRRLLVLDNAEHVLDAVRALVDALQREALGIVLLVTSQAPLHGEGEVVHALGGLSVPTVPCTAEEAQRHAAVALFVAHAKQADRRFRFCDEQVDDVVAVCASLAGSALGVQLAAALLGQMPLSAVRERLARRRTGPHDAAIEPAANVLHSALSWSYDLLSQAAQRVFRCLAVAQGPLPLALVRALAVEADSAEAVDEADAALADLVERSLVQCAPLVDPAPGDLPCYRLLEAPRALALQKLAASGERAQVLARMARALAPLGDRWNALQMQGEQPLTADRSLRLALPVAADILSAFEAALTSGLVETSVLVRLSSLPFESADLHAASSRMRWAQALSARVDEPSLPAALRGRALLVVTSLIRSSDLTAMQAVLALAVAAWREAGDVAGEFHAVARLAEATAVAGQQTEAEALLVRARELEDPAWPPGRRRVRLYAEGIVAGTSGDLQRALEAWREHLRLIEQLRGFDFDRLRALHALAHDELCSGAPSEALPKLREALAVARRLRRHDAVYSYLLPSMVAANVALGDLEGAREAAAEGWPRARALDADPWWADHLALLAAREGRLRTAARLLGLADAGYARLNDGRQPLEAAAAAQAEAAVRSALGAEAFARFRAEGSATAEGAAVFAAAIEREDGAPALPWDPAFPAETS